MDAMKEPAKSWKIENPEKISCKPRFFCSHHQVAAVSICFTSARAARGAVFVAERISEGIGVGVGMLAITLAAAFLAVSVARTQQCRQRY